MSDVQYTIQDMINAAKDQSPSNFQAAFNDIMINQISTALDAKKAEIAQNYFDVNGDQETTETEDSTDEDIEASVDNEDQS